jgi:hypothetical protein
MQDALQSIPTPPEGPFAVRWDPVPGAVAYVLCRLEVPVGPAEAQVFFAGGLDLLMERRVAASSVLAVAEPDSGGWGHRLVVARMPGRRLMPVIARAGADADGPPPVTLAQLPVIGSWHGPATVAADDPAPQLPQRPSPTRAFLDEPGSTGRSVASVIERGLTVREGASRGAASAAPAPPVELAADDAPPLWVIVGSPALLDDAGDATRGLRLLRGRFKVALVGLTSRAPLDRLAERVGVPLDAVLALPPHAPALPEALGCPPHRALLLTLPEEAREGALPRRMVARGGMEQAATELVREDP